MPDNKAPKSSSAQQRLDKTLSHLPPQTSSQPTPRRRRRTSSSSSDLPADYSDILSSLSHLRKSSRTPPTESRGYIKQKQSGKLWVRERIELLVDQGSLREIGSVAGTVTWSTPSQNQPQSQNKEDFQSQRTTSETPSSFIPSNSVQALARVSSRQIALSADDFTLRAGHADGSVAARTVYLEKLALQLRIPIIKLVDGSSGGGSVTTITKDGYSYVPPLTGFDVIVKQLNAGIPNIGAILGPAIGLGAARVTMCHFSVMAGDVGALVNAGPKVVANATGEEGLSTHDLGGWEMHCRNGTIDNYAKDEKSAIEQVKRVLSYLPDCGEREVAKIIESRDPPDRKDFALRSIVPRRANRAYEMRRIIENVVDKDSWFEIGRLWGATTIAGLARLGGRPVGVVANDPMVLSGALDAHGSAKVTRHLKLCDVMNLPILQFVDCPGYAIGSVAERSATMRAGVALAATYYSTTIPILSVIVRKCYGVAGGAMVDSRNPHTRVAWPSGEWGSLPLAGGIEASHSFELKEAEKSGGLKARADRYNQLEAEYKRLMNPIRTANAFGIEEIIDPADTRMFLHDCVQTLYEKVLPVRLEDRSAGRIRPVYC